MLKIIGIAPGEGYQVFDTEDNSIEVASVEYLMICKGQGVSISGCHYTCDSLVTECDMIEHSKKDVEIPEVWRQITCHAQSSRSAFIWYDVSNLGRVRYKSADTSMKWRIMQKAKLRGGYQVQLGNTKFYVHDLVVRTFFGSIGLIAHLDENVYNNRIDNLIWGSEAEQFLGLVLARCAGTNVTTEFLKSGSISSGVTLNFAMLNGEALTIVECRRLLFLAYNYNKGDIEYIRAYDLVQFMADGGVVEGCRYTSDGIHVFCEGEAHDIKVEVFRPIVFSGVDVSERYEVSNLGRVRARSSSVNIIVPVNTYKLGDDVVVDLQLASTGESVTFKVLDLVCSAFIPRPSGDSWKVIKLGNTLSAHSVGWVNENEDVLRDTTLSERLCGVRCYDSNGDIIGIYRTVAEASDSGLTKLDSIIKCCNDKIGVRSGGKCLIWRYVRDDDLYFYKKSDRVKHMPGNIIRQYNKDGGLVGEWFTEGQAAKKLGLSKEMIHDSCIDGNLGTTCGCFAWQRAIMDVLYDMSVEQRRDLFKSRIIRQYSLSGKLMREYLSLNEAAVGVGIERYLIKRACSEHIILGDCGWRVGSYDELYNLSEQERHKSLVPHKIRVYEKSGKFVGEFFTYTQASSRTGAAPDMIKAICNRNSNNKSSFGYIFRYGDDDEFADLNEPARARAIADSYAKKGPTAPVSEDHPWYGNWVRRKGGVEKRSVNTQSPFVGVSPELQVWYDEVYRVGVGVGEVWVPAPICNYKREDGLWMYEVSSWGRVRRTGWVGGRSKQIEAYILKWRDTCHGPSVRLNDGAGRVLSIDVCKLVATAFIPNPYGSKVILHKDGNVNNNRWDNLVWGT